MKARAKSAQLLASVVSEQNIFEPSLVNDHPQASTIKHYCFNVLRHYYYLKAILDQLVRKPLKAKDNDIEGLLLIALFELWQQSNKEHAIVHETVNACFELKKVWAKGLVNACLRNFIRHQPKLFEDMGCEMAISHPAWLHTKLKKQWPHDYQAIIEANQQHPPMVLRINSKKSSVQSYIEQLKALDMVGTPVQGFDEAIALETAMSVDKLPGFKKGHVSVQDLSAQRAARYLEVEPKMRVLDACAAPGGKTAHLLERHPDITLQAVEVSPKRAQRLLASLKRLGLHAKVCVDDAGEPKSWWDGKPFDRILLDAPCSGSGVIRRHPEIKILLNEKNHLENVQKQADLLNALWPLLKPNGILLYATCSIFQEENEQQISHFLNQNKDATLIPLEDSMTDSTGLQLFPSTNQDGFFYAKITKTVT